MINELLWFVWNIGQVAAVMVGWFVLISVVHGLLRGAREAVEQMHNQSERKR